MYLRALLFIDCKLHKYTGWSSMSRFVSKVQPLSMVDLRKACILIHVSDQFNLCSYPLKLVKIMNGHSQSTIFPCAIPLQSQLSLYASDLTL